MTHPYAVAHLTDDQLLEAVVRLNRACSETLASLLAHLAEVDRRELYLGLGHRSMFTYCTERLRLSEDEAFLRINAARAVARHPELLEGVADGSMHLSGIKLLTPLLDQPDAKTWIEAARGKSKRAIEEILPARAVPRAPVQAIRKLPAAPAAAAAPASGASPAPATPCGLPLLAAMARRPSDAQAPAPTPSGTPSCEQARGGEVPQGNEPVRSTDAPKATRAASPSGGAEPTARGTGPEASRYQIQLVVGERVRDKLVRAKELLRHQIPDGDLGLVVEQALDLLIAQQLKQRFGVGARARGARKREPSAAKTPVAPPAAPPVVESQSASHRPEPADACVGQSQAGTRRAGSSREGARAPRDVPADSPAPPTSRSRHIPLEVRREVFTRDEDRCTFIGRDGHRCEERGALELHHEEPFGRGGAHTADNVRLLCARHNAWRAQQDYGAERIREARGRRAAQREPAVPAAEPSA